MLAGYTFETKNIIEIVAAFAVWALLCAFFVRKKSFKMLLLFSAVLFLYVGIDILDKLFGVPLAKDMALLVSIFMIVAMVIVYQTDFKVLFFDLAKGPDRSGVPDDTLSDEEMRLSVDEIIKACQTMSKARTGALIVLAPTSVPAHILETGINLGALVSSPVLESIFNNRSPIHDGAVIIKGNRILAAGCFLPLSETQSVSKTLGTRHRAGIGITEESDMLTIIISEETGIISVAQRGELHRYVTPDRLRDILHKTLRISQLTKHRSL
ncbi:MAG: DNA integrity scanning protein DisA nucleotide-binding domain protein [Clostridia bacterium]|nr:DNA integrity scanning protein DisA nucleotide-binding domain protein [Clostridia bacterium]